MAPGIEQVPAPQSAHRLLMAIQEMDREPEESPVGIGVEGVEMHRLHDGLESLLVSAAATQSVTRAHDHLRVFRLQAENPVELALRFLPATGPERSPCQRKPASAVAAIELDCLLSAFEGKLGGMGLPPIRVSLT
jgi:hypothetical protein